MKYTVKIELKAWQEVEIEAESREAAEDVAHTRARRECESRGWTMLHGDIISVTEHAEPKRRPKETK